VSCVTLNGAEAPYFQDHEDLLAGTTAMTRTTMTSWIEIADERHFIETATSSRVLPVSERQHLHLGTTILSLPSRIFGAFSSHQRPRR